MTKNVIRQMLVAAAAVIVLDAAHSQEVDITALLERGETFARKAGDPNAQAEAARAYLAAAEVGRPDAVHELFKIWAKLPPEWRVPMLGVFAEHPRGFGAMIHLSNEADPAVIRTLAEAIPQLVEPAKKHGPELRLLATGAVDGAAPDIRAAIERALVDVMGPGSIEFAQSLYGAQPDEYPTAVGKVANAARQGNQAAGRVLALAARDPDPEIRTRAAEWLGANAATEQTALEAIKSMAADPDPNIRQAAAYALNAISSRRTELQNVLLAAAKDPDPHVRQTAIIGLAADAIRRNSTATDALIAATKDTDATARTKAVEGLGNAIAAGNDKARSFLKTLAGSKDPVLAPKAQAYLKKYPLRK